MAVARNPTPQPVRIANVSGRLTLVSEQGGIDVATESASRFGPDPQAVYGQWETFREWADGAKELGVRLESALKSLDAEPLNATERRSRDGLIGRQLTLR